MVLAHKYNLLTKHSCIHNKLFTESYKQLISQLIKI